MTKPVALFRVDGGKVWGVSLGHVRRCLLVADAIASSHTSLFIMKDYPDGVDYVRTFGHKVVTIPVNCDDDQLIIEQITEYLPDLLFVDLAASTYETLYEFAAERGIKSVLFDITGRCTGAPDFLVNDSIVSSFTAYHLQNPRTRLLLGPDYFIMPPLQEQAIPPDAVPRNIMITMGGSDPAGLTAKVVAALNQPDSDLFFTVVLGPTFSAEDEIRALTQGNDSFSVVKNPPDFMSLLVKQDVVISSAGRTLYECAHLGRPVIIVPSIEHEEVTAEAFVHKTGYLNMGRWEDKLSAGKLLQAVKIYKNNFSLRNDLFNKGILLVDGKGVERILAALMKTVY